MDRFVVAGSQGGDHLLRAFILDHGPDLASEVDPPTASLHGFSVPTFLAGIEMVRQSDLLLSMPQRLAKHYRGLVVTRALPVPSPSFEVTLVWHARTDGSRPHAWFRALIKKLDTAADPRRLNSTATP